MIRLSVRRLPVMWAALTVTFVAVVGVLLFRYLNCLDEGAQVRADIFAVMKPSLASVTAKSSEPRADGPLPGPGGVAAVEGAASPGSPEAPVAAGDQPAPPGVVGRSSAALTTATPPVPLTWPAPSVADPGSTTPTTPTTAPSTARAPAPAGSTTAVNTGRSSTAATTAPPTARPTTTVTRTTVKAPTTTTRRTTTTTEDCESSRRSDCDDD